jgi:hypothetical protein
MELPIAIPIAIFGLVLAITGTIVVWVKNRKFSRVSCLWIIAILGISLCVISFFLLQPRPQNGPPSNFVSDTDVSGLTTEITWPIHVVRGQSFALTVLITPTPALTASATAEPGQTQVLSQLTPVGTPKVPISKAFGPKFDAFAIAELSASAFDVAPQQQATQSLDQRLVKFDWTLTPRHTDKQTLSVTITGVWIPKSGGKQIERPLAGHLLHISVTDTAPTTPFFVLGQLTFSDLFVALISSALNIPWIVELFKKRQETKKEKSDTALSATLSLTEKGQKEPKAAPASPTDTSHTSSGRQKKKKQPHN